MNGYCCFVVAMAGGTMSTREAVCRFAADWEALPLADKRQWKLYSRGMTQLPALPPPLQQGTWAQGQGAAGSPLIPASVKRAMRNDLDRGCNAEGQSVFYQQLTRKQLPEMLYDGGPDEHWTGPYGESRSLMTVLKGQQTDSKTVPKVETNHIKPRVRGRGRSYAAGDTAASPYGATTKALQGNGNPVVETEMIDVELGTAPKATAQQLFRNKVTATDGAKCANGDGATSNNVQRVRGRGRSQRAGQTATPSYGARSQIGRSGLMTHLDHSD